MDKFDGITILVFITCDATLENLHEIRYFYNYYYKNIKSETKEILKKLFK